MKLTHSLVMAGVISGIAMSATLSHAQTPAPAPEAQRPAPIVQGDVVEFRTTVLGVDQQQRTLQVADDHGKPVTFLVGPDVHNFAQVKKGDRVIVAFKRAVAISVSPGGSGIRSRIETQGAERAAPGQRPGADAARNVKIVATVQRIDRQHNIVTVRGPNRTVDVAVQDPKLLEGVKVGDSVAVDYTEAVAVAVTPAPTPPARPRVPPRPVPSAKP